MPILGTINAAAVDNWQDRSAIGGTPPVSSPWGVAITPVGMTPRYGAGVDDTGSRIILAGAVGTITTSLDQGVTWAAGNTTTTLRLFDVEYINNQWIIARADTANSRGPDFIYSNDGNTWLNTTLTAMFGGNDIARSTTGSQFYVAVGNPVNRNGTVIFLSTSLTGTWSIRLNGANLQSIRYLSSDGYEGFIAVGYYNNVWVSQRLSTDISADEPGINWVSAPTPAASTVNLDVVLVFEHPSYTRVIVGCSNGVIYYTDNWYAVNTGGVTWTQATVTGGNTNTLQNGTVNYFDPDNPIAYLVGAGGTILRSADGITWTRDVTNTTELLACAVWVPGTNTVIVGGGQTTGIILRGN